MDEGKRFDAVIVGASLGGLTSAALLAARGYHVAVIDKLEEAGGRCGSVDYNGYQIAFGHRDGHGVGDNVFGLPLHYLAAAHAAGAKVEYGPLVGGLRIHRLPARTSADLQLGGRAGQDRSEGARATIQVLTGYEDVSDESGRGYLDVIRQLVSTSPAEQQRLIPMTLGDWLDQNAPDGVVRDAILQFAEVMFPSPAEHTSVGRFIGFLQESRTHRSGGIYPQDPESAGMQGLIAPWLRVIEGNGGELWLGWKPVEIVVEDRRVVGVVAVNDANLVQEFVAPVVITDYPGWELLEIIDHDTLPAGFAEAAERMLQQCNDLAGWWAGLSRLPTRRSDGKTEDMPGWHRILWGEQRVKRYHGAFQFASCHSSTIAPTGKHLLEVVISHWGENGATRWRRWKDARAAVDRIIDYVRWYYTDLDECLEWSRYQYLSGPEMRACFLKPVTRHPVKVATVEGLYLAGSTSEGLGAYQDLECEAAMKAVDLVESDMGRAGHDRETATASQ